MDKFERAMAKPVKMVLELDGGKEEYEIHPLPFEYVGDIVKITKSLVRGQNVSDAKQYDELTEEEKKKWLQEHGKDFLESIDEETMNSIKVIVSKTLNVSFPEQYQTSDGKKKMDRFAMANWMEIFMVAMDANSYQMDIKNKASKQGAGIEVLRS